MKLIQATLLAGLCAGVLDLTGACVTAGISPIRVMQSVASGLIGARAFKGGTGTAMLGIILHFVIAVGAAAVYVFAVSTWMSLGELPFVSGPLYGIAVFWFMQGIVLPLSAIAFQQNFTWPVVVTGMIVHILCVGMPIALIVSWWVKD